jgi:hypothetical protein
VREMKTPTSDGKIKSWKEKLEKVDWGFILRSCLGVSVFIIIVLALFFFQELKGHMTSSLTYIRDIGVLKGSILLCVTNILGALAFLPCLPWTLGAGLTLNDPRLCSPLYVSLVE